MSFKNIFKAINMSFCNKKSVTSVLKMFLGVFHLLD
jgi:hypothetical protein